MTEAIKWRSARAKLQGLRDSGNDPFGANWEQSHVSQQAVELLSGEEEIGPEVSVAGRSWHFD